MTADFKMMAKIQKLKDEVRSLFTTPDEDTEIGAATARLVSTYGIKPRVITHGDVVTVRYPTKSVSKDIADKIVKAMKDIDLTDIEKKVSPARGGDIEWRGKVEES